MVVEDDAALREIYSIRITAEGYEVVSAGDGEEALAVAVREKPDLILSDVMMPKISGFDMLDILRSTPETANIKVIMMTALSGDDQRARGERLGADKYLVKSQVGIEDVVNSIHEVLGDRAGAAEAPASETPAPAPTPAQPVQAPATSAPGMAPVPEAPVAPAPVMAPMPETPVEPAPQPVEPASQPVEPAPQPIEPVSQPVEPAPQPVETQPNEQPAEQSTEPTPAAPAQ